jgi:predicted SprT family Zn-dependent metalloprotease
MAQAMPQIKIPKKFKLLGHEITVVFDNNYHNKEDYIGHAKYRGNKIIIDNNNTRTAPQIQQTFYHELIHWVLYFMKSKKNEDEDFVDMFAEFLNQAFSTMEY